MQVAPFTIIHYKLLPKDMSVDKQREWKGKVIKMDSSWAIVESLEPGYEGLQEVILLSQVTRVEGYKREETADPCLGCEQLLLRTNEDDFYSGE